MLYADGAALLGDLRASGQTSARAGRARGLADNRGRVLPGGPEGTLAAIVDSEGYVALVVNHGSAATTLGLAEGTAVVLE